MLTLLAMKAPSFLPAREQPGVGRLQERPAMLLPRRQFLRLAAGVAPPPVLPRALAQAYPARPVRMIVPFAPDGPTDVGAGMIAPRLSERFGTQFYVESVPGASGSIGTGQSAKAKQDGYTILVNANNHVINPTLYGKVPTRISEHVPHHHSDPHRARRRGSIDPVRHGLEDGAHRGAHR
jgi:hypothetical protein